jgi:hypothetical protein
MDVRNVRKWQLSCVQRFVLMSTRHTDAHPVELGMYGGKLRFTTPIFSLFSERADFGRIWHADSPLVCLPTQALQAQAAATDQTRSYMSPAAHVPCRANRSGGINPSIVLCCAATLCIRAAKKLALRQKCRVLDLHFPEVRFRKTNRRHRNAGHGGPAFYPRLR